MARNDPRERLRRRRRRRVVAAIAGLCLVGVALADPRPFREYLAAESQVAQQSAQLESARAVEQVAQFKLGFLTGLSQQAAVAIENARLFEEAGSAREAAVLLTSDFLRGIGGPASANWKRGS